jgi:Fic family protein
MFYKWRNNIDKWRKYWVYMPKKTFYDELNIIMLAARERPEGCSFEQLGRVLNLKLTRRTLQRRLAYLVEANLLHMTGSRKGTRYHAQAVAEPIQTYQSSIAADNDIKRYLQQSLSARKLVGYQREFLDQYRPNETAYLSDTVRKYLRQIGAPFSMQRPAGTYAREILNRLLIDLSWNSSRLEGNTYSLLETEQLLAANKTADGKTSFETQMILNHKNAIEFLVAAADEIAFNPYTIFNLHALLANNLLSSQAARGRLRTIPVAIHGSAFRPTDLPQLLTECFYQILEKATAIQDPYEQAFFVMVQLPYLQPFEDVNKRVSRLAANIPLIKHNLCPLSFIEVDNKTYVEGLLGIYELNRIELLRDLFIWAYERSALHYSKVRHVLGEPDLFILHYRSQIQETVSTVVKKAMDKKTAIAFIQQQAALHVPDSERAHYIAVVETELLSLHIGNIACHRLLPAEFELWQAHWN